MPSQMNLQQARQARPCCQSFGRMLSKIYTAFLSIQSQRVFESFGVRRANYLARASRLARISKEGNTASSLNGEAASINEYGRLSRSPA